MLLNLRRFRLIFQKCQVLKTNQFRDFADYSTLNSEFEVTPAIGRFTRQVYEVFSQEKTGENK